MNLRGTFLLALPLLAGCFEPHIPYSPVDPGPPDAGPAVDQSVARRLDEVVLDAIRRDLPRPPVHARNLYHFAASMYDAWAAFEPVADGVFFHEKHLALDSEAARDEAVAYAGARVIRVRYANAVGGAASLAELDAEMRAMGYDPTFTGTVGDTPAAIGNRVAQVVLTSALADGANESANYADPTYTSLNAPLIVSLPGNTMTEPNRWQPLALDYSVAQNGIPLPAGAQVFVGSQWGSVTPFALTRPSAAVPYVDPGPPPSFGTPELVDELVAVLRFQSQIDPADPETIDLSPGVRGNNPVGSNAGTGHPQNPATGLPYAPNVVRRADYGRAIAEFWADGPRSETPPGHWNVVANVASDHPAMQHRYAGTGEPLPRLEWDVKMYLALNGALHDAAIAAWGLKRVYDSSRPISLIRYAASLGQSSEPGSPSYDPLGLPLVPGLIELATPASCAPGERHAELSAYVGEVVVRGWPGQPTDPETQARGVHWMRAKAWTTYQRDTFVTPPFAGFVSGHSTFSRSAAEVLVGFTGDTFFPGGLYEEVLEPGDFFHEYGPTATTHLQWATYYDAADEAGISRLWGGIHISSDDLRGRETGQLVGTTAWARAQAYFDGTALP